MKKNENLKAIALLLLVIWLIAGIYYFAKKMNPGLEYKAKGVYESKY